MSDDLRAALKPARPGGKRRLTFDNGRYEEYQAVFVQHSGGEWDRILIARDDGSIARLIADLINGMADQTTFGECGFNEPHDAHEYVVAEEGRPADRHCPGLAPEPTLDAAYRERNAPPSTMSDLRDVAREVVRFYGTDRTWSLAYRTLLGSRIDDLDRALAATEVTTTDDELDIASRVVAAIERILTDQALNTPLNREALISVVRTAAFDREERELLPR